MNLDKALLEARKAMTMPTKKSTAEMGNRGRYRYADLSEVLDTVTGPLLEHGVLLRQYPANQEGAWVLITELTHGESGESRSFSFPLLVAKQDAQGFGSSVTYSRRYAILGLLALAPEDDDGKQACAGSPPIYTSTMPAQETKTVALQSVQSRNAVTDMVSLLTTSDAEVMGFIAYLAKSDNSQARWEQRAKDEEGLKGAFKSWRMQQGIPNE